MLLEGLGGVGLGFDWVYMVAGTHLFCPPNYSAKLFVRVERKTKTYLIVLKHTGTFVNFIIPVCYVVIL